MVADSGSFSPSAAKPAQVVASWQRRGLPLELHAPAPATLEELDLAHDPAHVRAVLAGRAPNGFGDRSAQVAASLPYTTGAMLSAARHAVAHRTLACAPCSGFHHAGYRRVAGFCTFNGLMVTACALRREGLAARVGILDCDTHYGDGTDAILAHLGAGHGAPWVRHFTTGAEYHAPAQAEAFLARLPELCESMRDCDVVLYQAGADPHVDDPLGGLGLAEILFQDQGGCGSIHITHRAAGLHFDPRLVRLLVNRLDAVRAIYARFPDDAGPITRSASL